MQILIALLLLAPMLGSEKEKQQPDIAIVSGNGFYSPFFKLHYSLPQGWVAEDDQARMDRNRVEYENIVHRSKAAPPHLPYYGVTVAQVFKSYDLLIATPPRAPAPEKSPAPFIRFCALERSNATNSAGSHARLLLRFKIVKMLHKGQNQTISGRKFVRTDVVTDRGQFIAMFETMTKDYLLLLELHGRDEQGMNELAQTMQSLAFDK